MRVVTQQFLAQVGREAQLAETHGRDRGAQDRLLPEQASFRGVRGSIADRGVVRQRLAERLSRTREVPIEK